MIYKKTLGFTFLISMTSLLVAGGKARNTAPEQNKGYKTCRMRGLQGKLPMPACLIRDFLKALDAYQDHYSENDENGENYGYQKTRNAYLFHGEMGVGKTTVAQAAAKESEATVLYYSLDDLVEHQSGQGIENQEINSSKDATNKDSVSQKGNKKYESNILATKIERIYSRAKEELQTQKKPVLLIFDDLSNTRQPGVAQIIKKQLVKHTGNPYITTICITNSDIAEFNHTLVSCCQVVECSEPDQEDRDEILFSYIVQTSHKIGMSFIQEMAKKTGDFTVRELQGAIQDARVATPSNEGISEEEVRKRLKIIQGRKDLNKSYSQRIIADPWCWLIGYRL